MTEVDLAQEVSYLRDLFQRKLMEDRSKNALIQSVQDSLVQRDSLTTGEAFRAVFQESLVALDRLRTEEPSKDLSESVIEELLEVFARRGLEQVPTNVSFDPRYHEIVETVVSSEEYPHNQIVYVEREGYLLGERLLRPARVVIAFDEKS